MKNYMEYKGYRGTISYCGEDRILYGKVLGTKDSISYEGESVSELESDFHAAVDDYLEVCKETEKSPQQRIQRFFQCPCHARVTSLHLLLCA